MKSAKKHAEQAHNVHRARKIMRRTLYVLVALTIIKAVGGYITNIIPLFGDALGSFADVFATLAIFIGLMFSERKPSENFTYGYHRIETLITLFMALFIIAAGGKIFYESIFLFYSPGTTSNYTLGIIASFISIVLSLVTYLFQYDIGKKIGSKAILASASDKRNDAFVSFGVLLSVFGNEFQIPYIEAIIGCGISVLVIWTGVKYMRESVLDLLDYWDEPEVTSQIRQIIEKSKLVMGIKTIRLRHVGTYIFGEAIININPFADSKDLRDELHRLDREIEENVEHLGDIVLYVNAAKPETIRVAVPVIDNGGLHSIVAEDTSVPFYLFIADIKNGKVSETKILPDTYTVKRAPQIAEVLEKEQVNILISSLLSPLLYYQLRLQNIRVYPHLLETTDVETNIKLLLLDI